jgi:hypothetical protein
MYRRIKMSRIYNPIYTEATIDIFEAYINLLDIPIIDYIAIGVQDTISKTSTSIIPLLNESKKLKILRHKLSRFDNID